ncbi:MAG: ATP-binding cassette domain-containing protein [bacterium]|nr:ATP-binding cassette domain-containing protein [bacterium]
MPAIDVQHLSKHYFTYHQAPGIKGLLQSFAARKTETVKAVDNISFTIEPGELVGFIGPNGAGKTTTLKCLSGLLHPTKGQVSVLGFSPWERKPEFQKQFALVAGQKNQLWWNLPARETFILNKEIYEVPDEKYRKTLKELLTVLEAEDILDVQVRKLSLGQRMKCELIAALVHSPQVLFLDEPTIGLDVVMQKKIRDFIRDYNQREQATVILTSHYMADVAALCQRVLIIDQGKLVFDGELAEIFRKYVDHKVLSITLSKPINKEALRGLGEIKEFAYPRLVLSVKREEAPLVTAAVLEKLPVEDLNVEEPAIEDVIRELFTGKDYA